MNEYEWLSLLNSAWLPGLSVADSKVAKKWLMLHAQEFDTVEWQVRVGSAQDIGPAYGDALRKRAATYSQKKVDILGRNADGVTIIEVKQRITVESVGQILAYRDLWRIENPTVPVLACWVIGSTAAVDAEELLQARGVHVGLFP
jgi:hypothetical protein